MARTNTVLIGRAAEMAVAEYISLRDFRVLDRNWRTKTCEIDIVAIKAGTVHFIEVKYRGALDNGDGFDYITPAKLRRMKYAARMWVTYNKWSGPYTLGVASVDQDAITFIESIY